MDQIDYFNIMKAAVNLKRKTILEIGGAVPPEVIAAAHVASWIAIDKNKKRFEINKENKPLPLWYRQEVMDDYPAKSRSRFKAIT